MPLIHIKGNIFNTKCQTLVNPVNCAGVMGKGLALEFQMRYPEMISEYVRKCQAGRLVIGNPWLYQGKAQWVLNFPTKKHWRQPARIDYIESGLSNFRETYKANGITAVAFPQLGTECGGLDWACVQSCMEKHLEDLPIVIEIYSYDSSSPDNAFVLFSQNIPKMSRRAIKKQIGLNENQVMKLLTAMEANGFSNFHDLKRIGGFGNKTMQKIHAFCKSNVVNAEDVGPHKQYELL